MKEALKKICQKAEKTAANEVWTTVHAVSFHMRNIYEKLESHSKSEAVAKAFRDRIGA